jgi:hypothetical protein
MCFDFGLAYGNIRRASSRMATLADVPTREAPASSMATTSL